MHKNIKRSLYSTTIIAMLLFSGSCKKFLEESSQDLVKPVTAAHYKELLQGEGYFKEIYAKGWFVGLMTDDVTTIDPQRGGLTQNSLTLYMQFPYQWAADLEAPTGIFTDQLFQHLYKNIATANSILAAINHMEGSTEEKQILQGQAMFTRAYAYFILANLYAQAYNEASAEDLCVPLVTDATPSMKQYPRATIKEVWDLIVNDIVEATELLSGDSQPRSVYEVNYRASLLLASRIFLYREQYDKVLEYGQRYLNTTSALKDISTITSSPARLSNTTHEFLYAPENPEIVFVFGTMSCRSCIGTLQYFLNTSTQTSGPDIVAGPSYEGSTSLIGSYEASDRRKNHWFAPPTGSPGQSSVYITYSPFKYDYDDGTRFTQAFRTAEIYLNMAEAYSRKENPDVPAALNLLNQLRSNRIGDYTALQPADFAGTGSLPAFILAERRRELCFDEFHRWWDLRRSGQPSIRHQWLDRTYVLEKNDPAYLLNFPKEELNFNRQLVQNPRPERNPVTN